MSDFPSQLVIFRVSSCRILPAISATTSLTILTDKSKPLKRPAIEVKVGDIIQGSGLVTARYIYTLTQHNIMSNAIPKNGQPLAEEEYI